MRAAFGQRRKTLRNALATLPGELLGPQAMDAITGSGIDLSRRGETLTVREFAQLADAIAAARESTSPVGLES